MKGQRVEPRPFDGYCRRYREHFNLASLCRCGRRDLGPSGCHRASTKCTLETPEPLVPLISLNIPLETGGQRVLWAMRTKDEPIRLTISAGALGPTEQAVLYPAVELGSFDVDRAVNNLAAAGHIKLLNNILSTWRSAFRLSQNQIFASVVREITLALTPEPRQVRGLRSAD